MTKNNKKRCLIAATFFTVAVGLFAQATPRLDSPLAGAVVVSGAISPGASLFYIYDISYPAKTKLGESKSIDAQGNFAVSVTRH